jgi:hypothetical protein
LSKSGQTENPFADHMCTNISITYHLIMSFYLPEQSALLFQLAIHWQDPDSPQNPCVLQSASVEQEKTERRKTIIQYSSYYFVTVLQKIPLQLQSKQYCFKGLSPQQSPPSNWHGTLLLISSHDPSDIHSSNPPAITAIRKLGKLHYRQIWI